MDLERVIDEAWERLPAHHKLLLENVGAEQRCVVFEPLGEAVDGLRRSAGLSGLSESGKRRLRDACGVWIPELRLVVLNAEHPGLQGLTGESFEAFGAEIAWHEWGHALSIARCSPDDVAAGRALLDLCPPEIRDDIRAAGYGARGYTHEIMAVLYSVMMRRRVRGQSGQPPWLANEIYALFQSVTDWTR
jgi:hypothetical protein